MMPLGKKICSGLYFVDAVVKKGRCASIFCTAVLSAGIAFLAPCANSQSMPADVQRNVNATPESITFSSNDPEGNTENQSLMEKKSLSSRPDFNRDIFFRNKFEFSVDVGWLPFNVPFPFDFIEGDAYDLYPIRYTLVPIIASLRWHTGNLKGPIILRGNSDVTFSLSEAAIPRGPETHYFSYDMGIRRNFVPRNWRVTPYYDVRAGLGIINAKGPLGVYYAQGQNFTFTLNMGAGARYNFNPRYAISAGLNWMHISNANLSAPAYSNYGINVYGPVFGLDVQLRKHPRQTE
jgi:hypothetical protein